MRTSQARRQKRERLFNEQDGRCYWCGRQMRLLTFQPKAGQKSPDDMATLEHLDSRLSPSRGMFGHGAKRVVAACYRCNHTRASEEVAGLPEYEKHRRSGHRGKGFEGALALALRQALAEKEERT